MDSDKSSNESPCIFYNNDLDDDPIIEKISEKMDSDESSDFSHSILHGCDFYDPKTDLLAEKPIGLSLQDDQMILSRNLDKARAAPIDGIMTPASDGTVTFSNDRTLASTAESSDDNQSEHYGSDATDGIVVTTTGGTRNNTEGCNGLDPGNMTGTGQYTGDTGHSKLDPGLTYVIDQSPKSTNSLRQFQNNHDSSNQFHNNISVATATRGTVHGKCGSNPVKLIDMQPGWVELFQRYGTDVIKDIEKEYSVTIGYNDSGQYHICGSKNAEAETLMKKKVAVKKFRVEDPSACDILASQSGNLFLREAEDTCKCIIKIDDKSKISVQWENKPVYYDGWCQTHSNKTITLVIGRLCDLVTTMVVIPSNNCGYALKDFGDCFKGESEVMKKCIEQISKQTKKLPLWDAFFNNNTGSLPYSIICHASLVDVEHGEQKVHAKKNLEKVYKRVLEKAKIVHSLAIPLCDYGGPKVSDQIYAVKKTIKHYLTASCCDKTRLSEIVLCVEDKQEADLVQKMMEELSNVMDKYLSRLVFDVKKEIKELTRQKKNQIQVKIVCGMLQEMTADVYVNSTSHNLDLTQGLASKALLDAAGPEIQKECRQQKSLLNLGDFVITGPGKLKVCKKIFHGALPMWDSTPAKCEQVLKSFLKNCLLEACRLKMKSIVFPSLGVGQLQYPWHRTARTMYEAVNEFERENKKMSLEMVMFVIHPKDEMSKEAFSIEEKRQSATKSKNVSYLQCRNDKDYLEGVLRSNTKVVKITVCEGDMRDEPFDCTLIRMEKCDHVDDHSCPTEVVKYYSAAIPDSSQLHNEFKIHVRDEKYHLYKALYKACGQAMERRHTVLSFEVNKCFSKMPAGAMIEQLIEAMKNRASHLEFLLEVHIFVNSLMNLTNIEGRVNAMNVKNSSWFSLFASFMSMEEETQFDYVKLRKVDKKTSHYPQPPFTVSIQGFSMESCKEAKTKIKKYISVSDAESVEEENGDGITSAITSVFKTDKAEVNPGLFPCCYHTGTQKSLMDELKTKTEVNVMKANDVPSDLKFPASKNEYLAILCRLQSSPEITMTEMMYIKGWIRITCNENSVSDLKETMSSLLSEVRSSQWDEIHFKSDENIIISELSTTDLVMVLYNEKERKVILCSTSAEQLVHVKHKIMVQLGRIILTDRHRRKPSSLSTNVEIDPKMCSSLDSKTKDEPAGPCKNTFLTESGLIIKVYNMSITETNVDCIVNATDKDLKNLSGVSKAIADAAGKDFKAACTDHIRQNGALKSDTAVVLPPGSLNCKCVISIAGHAMVKREENLTALSHLENVIVQCLKVSHGRCLKSIAFPSVGSGVAGLDAELCAQQYYRAVNKFIQQTNTPLSLKEIHFVDINTSITQTIQATFAKYFLHQTADKECHSFLASAKGKPSLSSQPKSDASGTSSSNIQSNDTCVICMDSITDPKVLPKCGHTFCTECIDQQFMYKPTCPCCGAVYGKITGIQPHGTMKDYYENYSLPGFDGCGTIVILYEFNGGTQKAEHPHPGRSYHGTKHKAYLPNSERGKLVLKLLREAFDRRLVFTIGASQTTGQEDTVTRNDIHHKTNITGGPQKYGYPDSTYLDRVMDELAVKGITEDNL